MKESLGSARDDKIMVLSQDIKIIIYSGNFDIYVIFRFPSLCFYCKINPY